jgi:hypothetical protein
VGTDAPEHALHKMNLRLSHRPEASKGKPERVTPDVLRLWQSGSIIAALLGVTLLPFVLPLAPPMTDLFQHLAVAHIIANYSDPALNYGKYFELRWSLSPTLLAYLALVPLDRLLGGLWAGKAYLTTFTVALYGSAMFFLYQAGVRSPALQALIVLPLSFSWYVYMGFLPYIGTWPLYFCLLGIWLSHTGGSWARRVAAAVLLCLMYGFHIVGAVAGAYSLVALSSHRHITGRLSSREWLKDGTALIPLLVLTVWYLATPDRPQATVEWGSPFEVARALVGYTAASLDPRTFWFLFSGIGGLVAAAAASWSHAPRQRESTVLGLGLAVLGCILPISLGSLWPAGPRLFPFALMALVGSIHVVKKIYVVAAVSLVLVPVAILTIRTSFETAEQYKAFVAGGAQIPFGSKVLPIVVEPNAGPGHTAPFWSIYSLYTIERGATHPYVFAIPYVKTSASPLRYKRSEDFGYGFQYDGIVRLEPSSYRGAAKQYDRLVIWGRFPGGAESFSEEFDVVLDRPPLAILAARRGQTK